jgi:hypothetical protein
MGSSQSGTVAPPGQKKNPVKDLFQHMIKSAAVSKTPLGGSHVTGKPTGQPTGTGTGGATHTTGGTSGPSEPGDEFMLAMVQDLVNQYFTMQDLAIAAAVMVFGVVFIGAIVRNVPNTEMRMSMVVLASLLAVAALACIGVQMSVAVKQVTPESTFGMLNPDEAKMVNDFFTPYRIKVYVSIALVAAAVLIGGILASSSATKLVEEAVPSFELLASSGFLGAVLLAGGAAQASLATDMARMPWRGLSELGEDLM